METIPRAWQHMFLPETFSAKNHKDLWNHSHPFQWSAESPCLVMLWSPHCQTVKSCLLPLLNPCRGGGDVPPGCLFPPGARAGEPHAPGVAAPEWTAFSIMHWSRWAVRGSWRTWSSFNPQGCCHPPRERALGPAGLCLPPGAPALSTRTVCMYGTDYIQSLNLLQC